MLEIKCRSHKFRAGIRSLSHSLSPPLRFEHMLHKFELPCQTQRKPYSRSSGAHFPLPKEPFPDQSEGTNGYLWHLLAYQSHPGLQAHSVPVPGASQVFSPHPFLLASPSHTTLHFGHLLSFVQPFGLPLSTASLLGSFVCTLSSSLSLLRTTSSRLARFNLLLSILALDSFGFPWLYSPSYLQQNKNLSLSHTKEWSCPHFIQT